MRKAKVIILSDEETSELQAWANSRTKPHRLVERAKIVLYAAKGLQNKEIAKEMRISEMYVGRWRKRFAENQIEGICKDAPRSGRNKEIKDEIVKKIIDRTLQTKPEGATHWSTRTMGKAMSVSHMTVQRIWNAHNIQPHLVESRKVSNDPRFVEKVIDVVGLYVDPPEKAVVLSCDEKTQIQALERTQTILPLRPGLPEGRSHDYRRNGITDLFAALNMLTGRVITEFHNHHRHQEFLKFLKTIDANTDPELDIHLILDNLRVHTHPKIIRWLDRHERFYLHFVPTGCSWLNAVEAWFSKLTTKQIRRGSFKSVPALKKAILKFTQVSNQNPKPFVWTKPAEEIIRKANKIKRLLVTGH